MANPIAEFLTTLPDRVSAGAISGLSAVFQFVDTDDDGGVWAVTIVNGHMAVSEGAAGNADIILTAETSDWARMVSGTLRSQEAILIGRLRIRGDVTLAIKLQSIFHL